MLDFRKLELNDIPLVRKIYEDRTSRITDDTAGSVLMWREFYNTEIAEKDGTVIFKTNYHDSGEAFVMPVGDRIMGIKEIISYCGENGIDPVICTATNDDISFLRENFTVVSTEPTRDFFDYIYDAEKMKTFGGKKLSGQRNHKNNFIKNHPDWRFVPIDEGNILRARDFFVEFTKDVIKDSEMFFAEERSVFEVLDNFALYGLSGGMIEENGEIFGIAFGETVGDTLFVHIEKARRDVNGAYQMIASEFVSHFASEKIKFVNREDDGGDEGLRTSKMSYHPSMLIEKYIVTLK